MSIWVPVLERLAIRYYEHELGPTYNISSLSLDEIRAIKRSMFENEESLEQYIQYKLAFERIIRSKFLLKGGRAPLLYPIYFSVHDTERYKAYYRNPAKIEIPIRKFEPDTVSFTYGGTTINSFFKSNGHPTRRKVYTINEIDEIMRAYPSDDEIPVEMQVWCSRVIIKHWNEESNELAHENYD